MSATGSFVSSILGTYAGTMIQKHKEARDRSDAAKEAELRVLQTALSTGQLDQASTEATFRRMEEIVGEYGGKGGKKSAFSFGNLIGRFSDTGGAQQANAKGGGQGTPKTDSGAATSTAPPAQPPSVGAPPSRPQMHFQDKNQMAFDRAKQEAKARLEAESEARKTEIKETSEDYAKAHPNATQEEIFDNVVAPMLGIKQPEKQLPHVVVKDSDGNIKAAVTLPGRSEYFDADSLKPIPGATPVKQGTETKPTMGESAGYPYIKTGDPEKDLPAAEAAFRKGTKAKEDIRATADIQAARKASYQTTTRNFTQKVSQANTTLAQAKRDLAQKEKEARATGGTLKGKAGLQDSPDITKAKKAVEDAEKVMSNAKSAQNYINLMQQSVLEGTVSEQDVLNAANELAEKGYTTTKPPGPVTRKAGQ